MNEEFDGLLFTIMQFALVVFVVVVLVVVVITASKSMLDWAF